MYLGGALTMKYFHDLRAFLDTNTALEVRDMIPFASGWEFSSRNSTMNEVLAC